MSNPLRVGIIGTGEMGRPVVTRLQGAGFDVAAFARREETRAELAAAGVTVVDSPAELGRDRDAVLVYVYTDPQVREVALDDGLLDAMAPGSVLIVPTTSSPQTMEALAGAGAAKGVHIVDAPGSGGPPKIAEGILPLFVGGSDEAVERARPVLESYSHRVNHVGPLGSGQKVKLLNNLLFGSHVELAAEAARLAEAMGLDAVDVAQALDGCSGHSNAVSMLASSGSAAGMINGAGRFIHKDVLVAKELAADLGADLGSFSEVTTAVLKRTE